jgi:hypothetical protein
VSSPVRLVCRRPRRLAASHRDGLRLRTGALGFLGAREEDRRHWAAAFRRFLDGLDGALQVVMRFHPGRQSPEPLAAAGATRDERRSGDLEFGRWLGSQPEAQEREVELLIDARARDRARALLSELGIALTDELPVEPLDVFGEELPDALTDHAGWHRTWFLERFPGLEVEPGWLLDLIPAGLDIDLSYHVSPVPTEWMVHFLQRQLAGMRAAQLGRSVDPTLANALPAAQELQRQLAAGEERAYRASLYLTLNATSRVDLREGTRLVEQAARAALCALHPCIFDMLAGRVATLPLGVDPLARTRILDSSSLTTLFPWLHADLRQAGGLVIGTSRATGRPVILDPFDHAAYANANIGVFGHSGAGKTYLMSCLALGAHAAGAQVFVLDPEHEYGRLAKELGGEDVRFALGSGHALNVLERPVKGEAELGPAVADAVDLLAIICGGLDEEARAEAEIAVRHTFEAEDRPILRDVARRLPPASRAGVVLRRWVEGSLGALFSAPTNVDLDAPVVVFGMRELRDEMVAPVHFLLAEALWSRIKSRDRRRLLVIDELGLLFEDATIRRFVVSLARRIRKYDGSLLFATQNPGDLLSTEPGQVVATNPAIHFFGATRPGEAARLQEAFQLSPAQRAYIETARRGEFLLSAGPERLPIIVRASPWQAAVIEKGRAPPDRRIGRRESGGRAGAGRRPASGHLAGNRQHRAHPSPRDDRRTASASGRVAHGRRRLLG